MYSGISIYYHQYLISNPKKLIIAVDESFKMNNLKPRIREQLNSLKGRNYTIYSLVTSQRIIHDWETRPSLDDFQPFGPRDFEQMIDIIEPLSGEADEIIIITNAKDISLLTQINKSNIILLNPLTD
jgi:hypothetical protein